MSSATSSSSPEQHIVKVESLEIFPLHILITYSLDHIHKFQTKIFYPDGELEELKQKHSAEELRKMYCHIAFMEGLKFMPVFPTEYDVTAIEDGLTEASIEYFNNVCPRTYSQHIYENKRFDWRGPKVIYNKENTLFNTNKNILESKAENLSKDIKERPVLASNGGGKDSHLSMKLIQQSGIPFGIYTHARSEYGRFDIQHNTQCKHLKHLPAALRIHKINVFDDFTDGIFLQTYFPHITGECTLGFPCQVGFPEMIFESLPFVLKHGYSCFILGNERSANAGQAECNEMEDIQVNHQYLKSYDAEKSLDTFLKENLIKDFSIFSILRPIHDYRIYQDVAKWPEILPDIQSCNIVKPWCKECSKCAYVWANLNAVFDPKLVEDVFKENLFDKPCLQQYWKELLGLSTHNAFECVGENGETRLAFKACYEKGMKGKAMDLFLSAKFMESENWKALEEKYGKVYENDILIPAFIMDRIRPYL